MNQKNGSNTKNIATTACTNAIRKAKADHWKSEFQSANGIKLFWNVVKRFNGAPKTSIIGPLSGCSDPSQTTTDDTEKANTMNTFFVSKNLASQLKTIDASDSHVYSVSGINKTFE